MKLRIFYGVLVLCGFVVLPWWAIGLLVLIGMFLFKYVYFEAIMFGLLLDVLYVPVQQFTYFGLPYIFTTIFAVLLVVSISIKKNLRIYNND